ncbi:hypothetical protein M5D96_010001 [Drosophila gunungcola]|uniref:U2A'/phosphoprotein 32 family A C-terminal domain-containing protein n=1 Tax=Drosophila gunungcola TaxID=103775 RepID=A0A9Q0BMP7_9MUSC|nr:hypothetical protein M5D96_010001 [Drosophila gunungcola]
MVNRLTEQLVEGKSNVNKINTLSSLQNCHRLKELHMRKNKIPTGSNYRACVLRKLPQLKILDNVVATELEMQAALRHESYPEQKSAISGPGGGVSALDLWRQDEPCRERLERDREREQEVDQEEERQEER